MNTSKNFDVSDIRSFATLLKQLRKKGLKIQTWTGSERDLCDASAILHQLSDQAKRELVNTWVNGKPVEWKQFCFASA